MRTLHIALIASGAALLLALLSLAGYIAYQRYGSHYESPFKAIPGNTAMIIKLNKAGNLLEELNRSNLLWRELSRFPGVGGVRSELQMIDSAVRKNQHIKEFLQQFNLYVSITLSGRNKFGSLYLTNLPRGASESDLFDFVEELSSGRTTHSESPYASTSIHRLHVKGGSPFYFGILKGVFMGSYHPDLVKKAIDRLSLNTPMAASYGFLRVESTSGKNVDANIYLNYRFFSLVLSKITRAENLTDLIRFSHFADWSGLDLIIKKDELLFNGYTVASDSSQHFLSLFAEQKPQPVEVTMVIPRDVSTFTSYGWSDPVQFVTRLETRLGREEIYPPPTDPASVAIERFHLSLNDYFLPWLGNEVCYFTLIIPDNDRATGFTLLKATDSLLATRLLLNLADTIGLRYDSLAYHGHTLYRLPLPNFLPRLFGDLFSGMDVRCFTRIGGYILMASEIRHLEMVIRSWEAGDILHADRKFTDFAANLPPKSNLLTYFNTRNSIPALRNMLNQELESQLNPVMDSIRKFESIAFQYNNQEGLFYTNIFLRYDPNWGEGGPLRWHAQLDTSVTGRPQCITLPGERHKVILATDAAQTLYMLSHDGRILWKRHIMGTLKGEIHPIKIHGDSSNYLVFNTESHLYLLRSDGEFADKFPMRFPLHATNGITVADFEKSGKYTVFVAFQDNRVYCFTLDGQSLIQWKRPSLKEEIVLPVSVASAGGRNLILIRGSQGGGMIVDRDGEEQIITNPNLHFSPHSSYYPNRSGKRGLFVTTDLNGKAVFIQENGKTSEVTMNLFGNEHRFFYADITGNLNPEFIFADRGRIYYYNRNYKLFYSYAFRREMNAPPFLINNIDGKVMVGFVAPETNELFLFDQHGYCQLESGIRGNTPFTVGRLAPGSSYALVVGSGKMVKAFNLPQLK